MSKTQLQDMVNGYEQDAATRHGKWLWVRKRSTVWLVHHMWGTEVYKLVGTPYVGDRGLQFGWYTICRGQKSTRWLVHHMWGAEVYKLLGTPYAGDRGLQIGCYTIVWAKEVYRLVTTPYMGDRSPQIGCYTIVWATEVYRLVATPYVGTEIYRLVGTPQVGQRSLQIGWYTIPTILCKKLDATETGLSEWPTYYSVSYTHSPISVMSKPRQGSGDWLIQHPADVISRLLSDVSVS